MSETERVTLVGNLTADPELRSTPSGLPVTSLRLAVTPRVKDGDTWRDGETTFRSCSPAPSASTGELATHPSRPQRPAGSPPS